MTKLPDIKWTPLWVANPNRRWWQFWKPRTVWNPAVKPLFTEHDQRFDGIVWREVEELR